jgi:hypothetical protein
MGIPDYISALFVGASYLVMHRLIQNQCGIYRKSFQPSSGLAVSKLPQGG